MKRILILIIFVGCNVEKSQKININDFHEVISVNDAKALSDSMIDWEENHEVFLEFFSNYIIRNNDDFLSSLISFKNDTLIEETNDSISLFLNKNKDEIYDEISYSLNKFYGFFPSLTQTKVYIYNSGFNYGIISYDDIVAIGLDNYLNENSKFYKMLSVPDYLRKYKSKRYITANLIEVIFNSYFQEYYNRNNFLSSLIYKGKIMYVIEKCSKSSKEVNFSYTNEEFLWCEKNEFQIWNFFIENNLIFSNNQNNLRSYLDYSPFAKGMPQESPGRIAYYVGYKIFKKYAQKYKHKTLFKLITETDENKILSESKYRPKK